MTKFEWVVVVILTMVLAELELIRLGYNPVKAWWRHHFGKKYGRDFV